MASTAGNTESSKEPKKDTSKLRKSNKPQDGAVDAFEDPPVEPWPASQPEPSNNVASSVPSRWMPVTIHLVLFVVFAGTFLYNIAWDLSHQRFVFTDWIYLTHWNLTFQVIFCTIEVVSDFHPSFSERTASFRAKLFHTIVTPFCLFVCIFFWCLCFYNEELVRPVDPEERCEEWYNQVVHTLIVPAVMLQSMTSFQKPPPPIESFTITVICGFIYTCWSVMWGLLFDLWSYELFRILTVYGWLLMMLTSAAIICILQTFGRVAHQRLWQVQENASNHGD